MKILYDHQMFSIQKYGGITKYFVELMKHFPEEDDYQLGVLFSNNQHLKDNFKKFKRVYIPIPKQKSKVKGRLMEMIYKGNEFYSEYLISKGNYDLFHPTYYDEYFFKHLNGKPYVITVHDLIEFKFKAKNKKSYIPQMENIINNATRIISISENTKNDLIDILKIHAEKIDIIYHGYEKKVRSISSSQYGRYILYVGGRAGYKNFSTFLKSFKKISMKDYDLKLICVGSSFTKKESEEIEEYQLSKNIISIGVNESKLHTLYSNALAFIYPSLYEGFGMPILEAFANDCPVCLSNTSCFPEIAERAGVYFEPTDPESISYAIESVIYNKEYSKLMIERGRERLLDFSWKKCADETIKTYLSAVS